ncbi:hypothetical protein F0562_004825 [Nyssa sinensis]|uniref:EF-hand domain-containing protein n=1 Tax=Nyssa sinensis TaxID=561372 RepID=A0A5J5AKD7_9ASTE|nr:hypothetical protein F0562_004825 [Nyssa sinensis]
MDKQEQYKRVFNHFDDNGDGKISPQELQLCVASIGWELSLEDAEAAVVLMDADGDGLLGLEDFVRLLEGVAEEEKVKDLREAFKMYEMDGCDCITPNSLKRMLSSGWFIHILFAAALTRGLQELSQIENCSASGNSSTNLDNFSTISPALGLQDGSSSTQALARLANVTAASNE